jgi:hypothetical protein
MPVPVVVGAVAALAARLAAKKAVTRTVGGITGKGAAKINPIYKQTIPSGSVKVVPAISGRAAMSKIESRWKSDPFARAEQKAGQLKADTAKAAKAPKKPTVKINSNK